MKVDYKYIFNIHFIFFILKNTYKLINNKYVDLFKYICPSFENFGQPETDPKKIKTQYDNRNI